MYGIIKTEERNESILVTLLNFLCSFLESGQHGALTTGQMLTGISVLTDFGKHLLHDDELVRHEREIVRKLHRSGIALNIQNRATETEQVTQNRIILLINCPQLFGCVRLLFQNTLLNHFVHRGRR